MLFCHLYVILHFLTKAVVSRLGVIVVSILADLLKVLQVRVSVKFGHFLYGGHLWFNNAGESKSNKSEN